MKTLVAVFFVALATLQLASAQNCTGTSCKTCAQQPGCGWCTATQQCTAGGPTGPSVGSCVGQYWQWGDCVDCESFGDNCRECMIWSEDCFFCLGQNGVNACKTIGSVLGCNVASACPCDVWSNCNDCNDDFGCFWCGSNQTCQNKGTTCQMPAHTCPCSSNLDCRACMDNDNCKWCEASSACQPTAYPCPTATTCDVYCETQGKTCTDCDNLNGCVWCADTLTCVDELTASCFLTHTCPNCEDHNYCDPCLDTPGCQWCDETETCMEVTDQSCTFMSHSCTSYCSYALGCASCNAMRGCAWCDSTSSCVDVEVATCAIATSCSGPTECKFDGGAFVGGMFLSWGLIAIGVGSYFFYRWRKMKKPEYTSLQ